MFDPKLKEALGRVQKPSRRNEGAAKPGGVYKIKERWMSVCICFPDTYEVGISFLVRRSCMSCLSSHGTVVRQASYAP